MGTSYIKPPVLSSFQNERKHKAPGLTDLTFFSMYKTSEGRCEFCTSNSVKSASSRHGGGSLGCRVGGSLRIRRILITEKQTKCFMCSSMIFTKLIIFHYKTHFLFFDFRANPIILLLYMFHTSSNIVVLTDGSVNSIKFPEASVFPSFNSPFRPRKSSTVPPGNSIATELSAELHGNGCANFTAIHFFIL